MIFLLIDEKIALIGTAFAERERASDATYGRFHREERRPYAAAYYFAHKKELAVRRSVRYFGQRQEISAQRKAYRVAHREEFKAYYLAHKEEILGRTAAYRATHPKETRARLAAYRASHKEPIEAWRAAYNAVLKLDAFNAYGGPVCVCCGETLIEGLAMDHVNGDGARHRKETGKGGTNVYLWLKKNNYPPGFQVLCATCNVAKGTGDHCPHRDRARLLT